MCQVKKFLKIAGIAALVATLGVIAVGAVAFAQGPFEGPGIGPFGGGHGRFPLLSPEQAEAHHEQMQQAMADALGMTVEELDAAHAEGKTPWEIAEEQGVDLADVRDTMRVPFEQMLDQAIAGGMLTQEQADTIHQHMADGHGPWEGRGGFPRFPGKHGDHPFLDPEQAGAHHEAMQQAIADAFGLTVEELDAAHAEGKTLWGIAEEQGVDLAEVGEALKTAGQELLDQASADGTLTQEQADTIRQHMEDMPGRGPWGMRGRFPRFPHWHGDAK
jgi:hypothetical protein